MKAIVFDDDDAGLASSSAVEIPAELQDEAKTAREKLIEAVAEIDDALMERFLDGDTDFSADEILRALRKGTLAFKLVTVVCGSAFKNKGVQQLLDASSTTCRRPSTSRRSRAIDPDTRPRRIERKADRRRAVRARSRSRSSTTRSSVS